MKILIVDDEITARTILKNHLLQHMPGCQLIEAANGTEAIFRYLKYQPDIVLLDLVMPGMTGEELIDGVLARNPGIPILLSSAYGTIQTAVDAIKKGAYYYFEKPVDRARLLIIIERAIENYRALKLRIAITELDVSATGTAGGQLGRGQAAAEPPSPELLAAQADAYGKLFTIFVRHRAAIDRVTFWGINDRRSWRRTRYPLAFDADYQPKPALQAIIDTVRRAGA